MLVKQNKRKAGKARRAKISKILSKIEYPNEFEREKVLQTLLQSDLTIEGISDFMQPIIDSQATARSTRIPVHGQGAGVF